MEKLGRGTVAIKTSSTEVFVNWRIFGDEFSNGTTYNLYRDGELVEGELEVSNFTDSYVDGSKYTVTATVDGIESTHSPAVEINKSRVISVPLKNIGNYSVHLGWVGDLDGDGEFEFVVDRLPSSESETCKVEAYKMDGTRLWQIDLGPLSLDRDGIEGGAAVISNGMWDGVTVYDMDSDGFAEVIIKTADGTVFGNGEVVEYASTLQNFVSVVDGMTGAEKSRIALPTDYMSDGPLQTQFNIAYLDGINPSVVVKAKNRRGSGSFNLLVAAYDYNGSITQRWKWLQGNANAPEFHQQRIADVDLDGKDEICDGGYVLDDDGTMLYSMGYQGIVHGDRFQIGDLDPERPGLEGYAIQQDNASGLAWYYYDAKDGTILQSQYLPHIGDYARGNAADIDPNHLGYEMWTFTDGIYNVQDGKITNVITGSYPNFRLWWDGDLRSEMLDGEKFLKWNSGEDSEMRMLTASDYGASASWRNAPALYGDILGDWREEVVYANSNNTALLIFTTTIPTTNRIYTLLHNPEYRLCLTTRGYYQSAQLDYYLGTGMTTPPIPSMQDVKAVWKGTQSAAWNSSVSNWDIDDASASFTDGDPVLFGLQGTAQTTVNLESDVAPEVTYVISPVDYTFDGNGDISGDGEIIKAGFSKLTLNGATSNTGVTRVDQGTLEINDSIYSSLVSVHGGATLAGDGFLLAGSEFERRSVIQPGKVGAIGAITFDTGLELPAGMSCVFDLESLSKYDKIYCFNGDLKINGAITFEINLKSEELVAGEYELIQYSDAFIGDLGEIKIEGLFGEKFELIQKNNAIVLKIAESRNASTIVWEGSKYSWDLQTSENWLNESANVSFVAGDTVLFDESAADFTTIVLDGELPIGQMLVNGDDKDYKFAVLKDGMIGGEGGLEKNGSATLTFANDNNVYTGSTIINGGIFDIKKIDVAGSPSSIGANNSTAPNQFQINNAELKLSNFEDNYTDKGISLGGTADIINIVNENSNLSLSGKVIGTAQLTKKGNGTLYLLNNDNTYAGGTIIEAGTIQLNDPGNATVRALGRGTVTFKGGRLAMGSTSSYTTCDMNFVVPEGFSGTLTGDVRCNYTGRLTGAGTLNLVLPGSIDRTIFQGDWSGFKGKINVSGVAPMRLAGNTSTSYRNIVFNLKNNMTMYYSKGTTGGDGDAATVYIGGIEGDKGSALNTENWIIGASNESTVFNGKINGHALTKIGTGELTLTNSNSYAGGTKVNAGILNVKNQTGSGTGSGSVSVNNNGTLTGDGNIGGKVAVENGGLIMPGNETVNTHLSIVNDFVLKQGASLSTVVNSVFNYANSLVVGGKVLIAGDLVLNKSSSADYKEGDQFRIFNSNNIVGAFSSITPSMPGEGLMWDTSMLESDGIIGVVKGTKAESFDASKIRIYPNPVVDELYLRNTGGLQISSIQVKNISGQIVLNNIDPRAEHINFNSLKSGIYIVEIQSKQGIIKTKVIK